MSEAPSPLPSHPLLWFPEFLELTRKRLRPQLRVMGLSLLVGLIAGLGAVVFFTACQVIFHYTLYDLAGYDPSHPTNEPPLLPEIPGARPFEPWLLLVIPTVGGLLSGLIVYTFAPEAEGHGTDAAIAAYHYRQGRIRPRVPIVKMIASALTLGTGGSGGREGPIAQIGAGFGSFLGGLLRLPAAERRVLMAAGMGAGVGAIFRAPLAGALFAAEVLYSSSDFESDVIIPAGLATVIAYSVFAVAFRPLGWKPLFSLPDGAASALTFDNPLHLVPCGLLALFLVVLAMLYTRRFYGLTHLFHRLPIRPHFKPAIGAFLTGLLGLALWYGLGEKQVLAVLSFVFIGIAWAAHHDMFRYIRRTTHVLLILNLVFLMAIALQPFSTALVAEHYGKPGERTAALVYYGILLAASSSYNAVWWYAVRGGLVADDLDPRLLRALGREHLAAPALHAAALAVALWSVPLSFVPLALVYLLFALPRVTERWAAKNCGR